MKTTALLLLATSATFAETIVTPSYDSVSMFKNGLAIVRVSFPADKEGTYVWEKIPHIVHGSLWVESAGEVSVLSTTRTTDEADEVERSSGLLQKDLAGKKVTVSYDKLESGGMSQSTGTVWDIPTEKNSRTWGTDYSSLNPNNGSYFWQRNQAMGIQPVPPTAGTGDFLIIQEEGGARRYISQKSISSVAANGPFQPAKRSIEKPVLVFDVLRVPPKGGKIQLTYLTKGIAWLPSYQLDLTDPKKLSIRQNAIVRNEMADLENADLQLISGFPNVRFGAVDSPLWPGTSLTTFFQQLNQSESGPDNFLSKNGSMRGVAMSDSFADAASAPALAQEEVVGDDIYYRSIGKRSMKAGDSLSLDVATTSAAYERVVEWTVPDPRDASGRYVNNGEPTKSSGDAWDAVSFTNPFDFPMTSAAVTITEAKLFRGQSISTWVNPKQETSVKITRALSIRTEAGETEEEGQRGIVFVGGNDYQRTSVKGRLAVKNFREKDALIVIKCGFSGKLIEADGEPKSTLRGEGATSANPLRQLEWKITLPAGEEKELIYRYEVLVDR